MSETIIRLFSAPAVYPSLLILTALAAWGFAGFLLSVNKENIAVREKMPRMKIPGICLGAADLLWCIPNAMPILPENLHRYLLPLAVILLIASWFALDHLFARAIGGFMILSAHYFLKESFAAPQSGSAVFALLCLCFGTLGIYYSGLPYRVRDTVRLSVTKPEFRWIVPGFLLVFGADSVLMAILVFRSLS